MEIFYLHSVQIWWRSAQKPQRLRSVSVSVSFWKTRQKLAYPTEYLGKYWADLHQYFVVGNLIDILNWHSFCGSPRVIAMVTNWFWGLLQTSKLTAFTLCSGVRERIGQSLSGFQKITWRWVSYTSCNNQWTLELKWNVCCYLAAICRSSVLRHTGIRNAFEYCHFDSSMLIGNDFCT